MNKIILHATDLDGFLLDSDKEKLSHVDGLYRKSLGFCSTLDTATDGGVQ